MAIVYGKVPKTGKGAGLYRQVYHNQFAAGASHHIAKEKRVGHYTFTHFQKDMSDNFSSYIDAVAVGYNFSPSIIKIEVDESFGEYDFTDYLDYIMDRYKASTPQGSV